MIQKRKRGRPRKTQRVITWADMSIEQKAFIIWSLQDLVIDGYVNIFTNIQVSDGIVSADGYLNRNTTEPTTLRYDLSA